MAGTAWENTEYRSYEFADKTGQDPSASLVELPDSRRRRHGPEVPPTDAEMRAMRDAYETVLNEEISICLEKIAQQAETNKSAI